MEDPLEQIVRWERSGGHWRVLARTDESVTVGLYTCDGGEEMGRLTSGDPDVLDHVGDRSASED